MPPCQERAQVVVRRRRRSHAGDARAGNDRDATPVIRSYRIACILRRRGRRVCRRAHLASRALVPRHKVVQQGGECVCLVSACTRTNAPKAAGSADRSVGACAPHAPCTRTARAPQPRRSKHRPRPWPMWRNQTPRDVQTDIAGIYLAATSAGTFLT